MSKQNFIWEIVIAPPPDRPELTDQVSAWLEKHHSMGVVMADAGGEAVFEAGCAFQRTILKGYFPAKVDRKALERSLYKLLAGQGVIPVTWQPLMDQDWQEAWKTHWQPMPMGRRLLVQPTWLPLPEMEQGRLVIRMDPEMAFGSGSHETTRGCLEALERLADGPNGLGRLLDLGTGSGILAIAALLLGAESVLATDCDPVAVATAQRNALLNEVDGSRLTVLEASTVPVGGFQVVVANVLTGILLKMAPDLVKAVLPGGSLILSGILAEQVKEVQDGYSQVGIRDFQVHTLGEWVVMEVKQR